MAGEMETEETKQEVIVDLRQMDDYEEKAFSTSVMFSEHSPAEIMDMLTSKLKDRDVTYQLHDKKWKLTFDRESELDENEKTNAVQPEYCSFQVKLLRMPEGSEQTAIQFTRLAGSARYFYE
jgi:hypothetical protein